VQFDVECFGEFFYFFASVGSSIIPNYVDFFATEPDQGMPLSTRAEAASLSNTI
jgi:hypothetical protein